MSNILLVLGGAVVGAATSYYSPALWKPFAIRALRRRAVSRRALVLTYDDGPGPATTEALLELLAEFDAHATFFPSGERIADHRDVAQRTAREGHELGTHGYAHLHAWRHPSWALRDDFARGTGAVRSVGAEDPIAFRPPFGKIVTPTWLLSRQLGRPIAWWTDDSGDSRASLPTRSPAFGALERGGGVVLLHDLDRSEARNRFVLETTRELLEGARRAGLMVMTYSRLIAR